jgi:hypothetical protein
VFDPLPFLCDRELCSPLHNQRFVYRDSNHLSVYGGEYLSAKLEEWLSHSGDARRSGPATQWTP